jgi:hypothetical protein
VTGLESDRPSGNAIQMAEIELFSDGPIDFSPHLDLDVEGAWAPTKSSVYQRVEFNVADPTELSSLQLEMRYNDGFVAYLNGTRVAAVNAPALPNWQTNASADRADGDSLSWQTFNLTPFIDDLVAGENVLAIHVLNVNDASLDLLSEPRLTGRVLIDETLNLVYMSDTTPGAANAEGFEGIVATPQFSVERGFYNAPFQLTINVGTPGAQLYYTTNGKDPTPADGTLYTGPIQVNGMSTIRAQAYLSGYLDSTPATHTYVFLNDVVRQTHASVLAKGFPTTWGGTAADYAMDTQIIGNFDANGNWLGGDSYGGIYAATVKNDLLALPTMSIVMDVNDMFGPQGIYTNSQASGSSWERATSVELINPDGTPGFQIDAGIRTQGGAFRSHGLTRKHSLRLLFKGIYEGNTKLEYPLFGEDAATSFDTITLRAESNDGYSWDAAGSRAQYARDEFGRRSQAALGQHASHGTRVHLYINGVYWGIYNPVERPDASFSATYYGGQKEDWDAINQGAATDGDMATWNMLNSLAGQVQSASTEAARTSAFMRVLGRNADGSVNPSYETYLDATNYIDYLITNFYGGNEDWPHRNWYASRLRGPESQGFVFHNWDYETSLGLTSGVTTNRLNVSAGAGEPYSRIRSSVEFKIMFADRVHRAFFNNGPLAAANSIARYQQVVAELPEAIVPESARWGDMHNSSNYTKAHWQNEINNVVNWLTQREGHFLNQLRSAGFYPNTAAPTFNQFGGQVPNGFQLTMSAPAGTIYYTLDGSDPRMIGGGLSPTAIAYTGAVTLNLGANVKARVRNGSDWSALTDAEFNSPFPVRITELHYNPAAHAGVVDRQDLEFIELLNLGTVTVSLDGAQIGGFAVEPYTFTGGLSLAPGERIVVARNPAVFQQVYGGGVNLAPTGYGDRNLSNGGELVTLVDAQGATVQSFTYADLAPWPSAPDGNGPSLEIIDPAGDPTNPANWRASAAAGGSPGTDGLAPADFDGDGEVDGADLVNWKNGFGPGGSPGRAQGNADGDGDVDGADFLLWQQSVTGGAALAASGSMLEATYESSPEWTEAVASALAGWKDAADAGLERQSRQEELAAVDATPTATTGELAPAMDSRVRGRDEVFSLLRDVQAYLTPVDGEEGGAAVEEELAAAALDLALTRSL